jgi:hypothetical protein
MASLVRAVTGNPRINIARTIIAGASRMSLIVAAQ